MENSDKLTALARLGIDGFVNGATRELTIVNTAKMKLPTEAQLKTAYAEYEAETVAAETAPDPVTALKSHIENLEALLVEKTVITEQEKTMLGKTKIESSR